MVPAFTPMEEQKCGSAEDLLLRIRPRLQRDRPGRFIYRGGGDAVRHNLVPRALRDTELGDQPPSSFERILSEDKILRAFVDGCDIGAMPVPNEEKARPAGYLASMGALTPEWWPEEGHFPIWAIAQHYGLATRLLDWTHRPSVAAYFAARSCLLLPNAEKLAVCELDETGDRMWGKRLVIFRMPSAHNPRLAAQAGLFTVTRTTPPSSTLDLFAAAPPPPSIEEIINACTPESLTPPADVLEALLDEHRRWPAVLLTKYTLERQHAAELLELCRLEGVSGATLFPGYEGARMYAEERILVAQAGMTSDQS